MFFEILQSLFSNRNSGKNDHFLKHRKLALESVENRELLSVSALTQPASVAPESDIMQTPQLLADDVATEIRTEADIVGIKTSGSTLSSTFTYKFDIGDGWEENRILDSSENITLVLSGTGFLREDLKDVDENDPLVQAAIRYYRSESAYTFTLNGREITPSTWIIDIYEKSQSGAGKIEFVISKSMLRSGILGTGVNTLQFSANRPPEFSLPLQIGKVTMKNVRSKIAETDSVEISAKAFTGMVGAYPIFDHVLPTTESSIRLEATLNAAAQQEVDRGMYSVGKVEWKIDDTIIKNDVSGNLYYDHVFDGGMHGEKVITCTIYLKENANAKTYAKLELKGTFKLFFEHDGKDKNRDEGHEHEPNWFYYWKRDGALPALSAHNVVYDPARVAAKNATALYDGEADTIYVGPDILDAKEAKTHIVKWVTGGGFVFQAKSKGLEAANATLIHEIKHKLLYDEHKKLKVNGELVDNDYWISLEDRKYLAKKNNYSVGSPQEKEFLETKQQFEIRGFFTYFRKLGDFMIDGNEKNLETWSILSDTWAMAEFFDHAPYLKYGDNELQARIAGSNATLTKEQIANDWSNKGSQASSDLKKQIITKDGTQAAASMLDETTAESVPESTSVTPQIAVNSYGVLRESTAPVAAPMGIQTLDSKGATLTEQYSSRAVDLDGDSKADELVISIQVNVTEAGTYAIVSEVYDKEENYIGFIMEEHTLAVGTHTIDLHFDGSVIGTYAVDGPFELDLRIYNEQADIVDGGVAAYTTQEYKASDFKQFLDVTATGETPADTNANGLYDTLTIQSTVTAPAAGSYHIGGYLYSSTDELIAYVTFEQNLEAGSNSVAFEFDGNDIFLAGFDGPYTLAVSSFIDRDAPMYRNDSVYQTAAYRIAQFEGAQAVLNGTFSDRRTDDALTIDVGVSVAVSGTYDLVAYLEDAAGNFAGYAGVTTALSAGERTISLDFDADLLTGNGPWTISWLSLFDSATGTKLGSRFDAYTTKGDFVDNAWNLRLVSAAQTTLDLDWNGVDGMTQYVLQRKGPGETGFTPVYTGTESRYVDRGLTAGTGYEYRVQAVGSEFSDVFSVSTAPAQVDGGSVVDSPMILSTEYDAVNNRITVRWTDLGSDYVYTVYKAGRIVVRNGAGASYVDTNPSDGGTDGYTIVAYNTKLRQESNSLTTVVSSTAPSVAITGVEFLADGSTKLLWDAQPGMIYTVMQAGRTISNSASIQPGSWIDTHPDESKEYMLVALYKDDAGDWQSTFSNLFSAKRPAQNSMPAYESFWSEYALNDDLLAEDL